MLSRAKAQRRKKDDESAEVTYINERNKVFNKKINRYFNKYTTECVLKLDEDKLTRSGFVRTLSAGRLFRFGAGCTSYLCFPVFRYDT